MGADAIIFLDIDDAEVSLTGDPFDGELVSAAEGLELADDRAVAVHTSACAKSPPMRPPPVRQVTLGE